MTRIKITELSTQQFTGGASNEKGVFSKLITSGEYQIVISSVEHPTLTIDSVNIASGELKTMEVDVGKPSGFRSITPK
jgi:hypothetical protein